MSNLQPNSTSFFLLFSSFFNCSSKTQLLFSIFLIYLLNSFPFIFLFSMFDSIPYLHLIRPKYSDLNLYDLSFISFTNENVVFNSLFILFISTITPSFIGISTICFS